MTRKRIYVAGAYSADNITDVLGNMRKGMRLSVDVLLAGYAPFCPWLDYHFSLMLREGEKLSIQDYYDYSMAWLEVSDAILLVPGYNGSKGTQMEIFRAYDLGIPIYASLDTLRAAIQPK